MIAAKISPWAQPPPAQGGDPTSIVQWPVWAGVGPNEILWITTVGGVSEESS
jgi:hypothetical protein